MVILTFCWEILFTKLIIEGKFSLNAVCMCVFIHFLRYWGRVGTRNGGESQWWGRGISPHPVDISISRCLHILCDASNYFSGLLYASISWHGIFFYKAWPFQSSCCFNYQKGKPHSLSKINCHLDVWIWKLFNFMTSCLVQTKNNTTAAQEKCITRLLLYHFCVNLPVMVLSYPVFRYMGMRSSLPLPSWYLRALSELKHSWTDIAQFSFPTVAW